ncbi:VPLPA-CTERM sorting domain-containing protein [Fuscibacter oryzae]|nr:VPLPA-CTERM sorting domain-containing protein [Fuscibacter oryzae]
MFNNFARLLAFTISTLAATATSAATVELDKQSGSVFGTNGWTAVLISLGADPVVSPTWVAAGAFALKGDIDSKPGVELFDAFCLDIATWLRLPSLYSVTGSPFASDPLTSLQMSSIAKLFNTAYKGLDLSNATQSAGFQLALWEIVNEAAGNGYALGSGNFSAAGSAAATNYADSLLAGLAGRETQKYRLTFLQSTDPRAKDGHYSQNLVTVSPVPLPAAGLMLMAGLGGLGLMRRRRA